jgi:hypothetical protein
MVPRLVVSALMRRASPRRRAHGLPALLEQLRAHLGRAHDGAQHLGQLGHVGRRHAGGATTAFQISRLKLFTPASARLGSPGHQGRARCW